MIEAGRDLLERERELTAVSDALTDARRAHGRVVLVEAPAGLGKTTLLRTAAEVAVAAGFTSLRARASDLERDFAYGCVRQLLEPGVARSSGSERARLFEGAAALSEPLFDPLKVPVPSEDSAFAMLHGLFWLLNNLAEAAPLALALDDLHWADTESLRFLNYLAPRLEGLRLVVLAATRSDEGVTADLARLAAGPETLVLRLRPLTVAATQRLCRSRLGGDVPSGFAAACCEATGGNPFFLEALLREAAEQGLAADEREPARVRGIGPAAVAQAVLLRLSGQSEAATRLVRAVAVLGDGVSLVEAAALAEVSAEEAERAADLLITLGLLNATAGLEFAHPIVREAVYADLGFRERGAAHAKAAAILAASGASEERIAAQIVKAEPAGDPDRVDLLRRVAAAALGRGAPSAAASWLGRALAEPPPPASRGEVLLELGSAELLLGMPEALASLSEAVELIREPARLAAAVRRLANALTMSGDADGAVRALEATIPLVEADDPEQALLLEAELAAHAQLASLELRAPAAARLARHRDLEGATPGERLVLASLALERARASESADEAVAHIERALAAGRLQGEQDLEVAGTLYLLLNGLFSTDALHLADACLERALADAHARTSIPAVAFVLLHQGRVSLLRGALADAEADARSALELLTARDIRLGVAYCFAVLITALTEAGDLDSAEGALRQGGFEEIPPSGLPINPLLEARGILRFAQGRTCDALDDLVEFGRRDELWGGANPDASRWRSRAALVLAGLGEQERACRTALEDLDRARRWGAASGVGIALRAVALVEGGTASVGRLQEAVEVLRGSPVRLEHARALVDLGSALRRANRRAEARHALDEGLELAVRCGARPLCDRARTEMAASGGRPRRALRAGPVQLTPSERRIAELAAAGRSNPEIAQALFVTRKTVETHLGHVYRKLDIAGRAQLGDALAERNSRSRAGSEA